MARIFSLGKPIASCARLHRGLRRGDAAQGAGSDSRGGSVPVADASSLDWGRSSISGREAVAVVSGTGGRISWAAGEAGGAGGRAVAGTVGRPLWRTASG